MRLKIIEINRYENTYRVIDQDNRSKLKGSKESCEEYLANNIYFVMTKRSGIEIGVSDSFKTSEEAELHKKKMEAKESGYREEAFYIVKRA